jgi:hypothetical protein
METIPCYWPLAGKPVIPVHAFSRFLHKPPASGGQFYFATVYSRCIGLQPSSKAPLQKLAKAAA